LQRPARPAWGARQQAAAAARNESASRGRIIAVGS
jgi:hypothetical protein